MQDLIKSAHRAVVRAKAAMAIRRANTLLNRKNSNVPVIPKRVTQSLAPSVPAPKPKPASAKRTVLGRR